MRPPVRFRSPAATLAAPLLLLASALLLLLLPCPSSAMNKAELIDAVASNSGLSKADAKRALEGFIQSVERGLSSSRSSDGSGGALYIAGFGAFMTVRNEVCDGRDDDCNGRFFCPGGGDDQGEFYCGGTVCNGIDATGSDGVCTGIDNDCDLEVTDPWDDLGDTIEFYADEAVTREMGKFYHHYWADAVLELANLLDLWFDQSYACLGGDLDGDGLDDAGPFPERLRFAIREGGRTVGAGQVCSVVNPIYQESGNQGENPLYRCSFMETTTMLMGVARDFLDPDSDDDGIPTDDDHQQKARKRPGGHRGHVTVLKARLDGNGDEGGVLKGFAEKCGNGAARFAREFFLQAADALTETNDPLKGLADQFEEVREAIASRFDRAVQAVVDGSANNELFTADKSALRSEQLTKKGYDAYIAKADAALVSLIEVIVAAARKGDSVSLVGFGSFSISKRAVRTGRNPQTGKEIKIAAKNVVKFKAGADLSSKVNAAGGGGGGSGTPTGYPECRCGADGGRGEWTCTHSSGSVQCTCKCTHL